MWAVEGHDRGLVLPGAARVGTRGRGLAQRLDELVTSGAGPVRGRSRLVGVPPDLAGVPIPVRLLDTRRILLAAGVLAELLEPLGVAHRGIGLQRVPARFQPGPLLFQFREVALRFLQLLLSGREGLLGGGEVPAQLFVAALRQPRPGGLALGRDFRVPAVVAQEGGRRLLSLGQGAQRVTFLIQTAERVGHGRHEAGAERGQRLGERPGQQLLVGLLRQLRLAQLDQQVDQGLVAVRPEAEQCARPPPGGSRPPGHRRTPAGRSPPAASPWSAGPGWRAAAAGQRRGAGW